jgi:insecticidal toxin complex protein TccC
MNLNMHRLTPSVLATDPRGLPIRQIEYLRNVAGGEMQSLITRQQHDVAGRLTAQRDPRLLAPNHTSVYGLNAAVLKSASVDAGPRVYLPGQAGETLEHHDQRGNVWRTRYDQLLRVVALEENQQPNVETFVYADGSANPSMNLRGQLLNQVDPSGRIDCESYAMTGALLRDTFTSHDNQSFTSSRTYSPLGAVLAHRDAGGHQQQFRYDHAGQIQQVQLQLNEQATWQTVQLNAHYNAAGQIIEQLAGNGVTSRWQYAAADGRLHRHTARIGQQSPLQDSEYSYDRVGNITRIFDHTFTPTYFANQRVDGARDFSYDSLYRLLSASGYDDAVPRDNPGRPQPTDPNDRRNYVQTYTYDHGNNLVELRHVRDGANHTRRMRIDPNSNRGVRWNDNDPEPDFDTLFDRHGNQQMLQAGQPLQWNTRDQLEKITLVARDNLPDDEEFYEYSQGARVYKRHTHDGGKHFHAVRYLPGLEIRSKDNGETLHVITLATGVGSVRCLHWLTSPPSGVEQTQMRYSLEDHLGSSTMELDHQGRMISHEGYYPFGATAWMAARSLIEVAYKFIRYSGKEMDVSGLYFYGARYYAPWLQRWVSADPGGDVDGLNLYAFVGNNPMNYFDDTGLNRSPNELKRLISWNMQALSSIDRKMSSLQDQLIDLQHPGQWRKTLAKNVVYQIGSAAAGWFTSYNAATFASEALPGLSADLIGLTLGNNIADRSVGLYGKLMAPLQLNSPIVPRTSTFNPDAIAAELQQSSPLPSREQYDVRSREGLQQLAVDSISKVVGAYVPGVGEAMALGSLAQEANEAEEGLSSLKLAKIHGTLDELDAMVTRLTTSANTAFAELGINEFYDEQHGMRDYLIDLGRNRVGTAQAKTLRQSDMTQLAGFARNNIETSRGFLNIYQQKVPAIRNRYRGD